MDHVPIFISNSLVFRNPRGIENPAETGGYFRLDLSRRLSTLQISIEPAYLITNDIKIKDYRVIKVGGFILTIAVSP